MRPTSLIIAMTVVAAAHLTVRAADPQQAVCWLDSSIIATGNHDILVLDLNGDGLQDVLLRNTADNTLSAMLSDGTGSFVLIPDEQVSGLDFFNDADAVQVRDLDGDGDDDIVRTHDVLENIGGNGAPPSSTAQIEFTAVAIEPFVAPVPGPDPPQSSRLLIGAADTDGDGECEVFSVVEWSTSIECVGAGGPGVGCSGQRGVNLLEHRLESGVYETGPGFSLASQTWQAGSFPDYSGDNDVYTASNGGLSVSESGGAVYVTTNHRFGRWTEDPARPSSSSVIRYAFGAVSDSLTLDSTSYDGLGEDVGHQHAVADYDGDGAAEVWVRSEKWLDGVTTTYGWLFDHATGAVEVSLVGDPVRWPSPAVDWNQDGLPDIADHLNDGGPEFPMRGGIELGTNTRAWGDFNADGYADRIERLVDEGVVTYALALSGFEPDYNADGVADACQVTPDENDNGLNDWEEIWFGLALDCNGNLRLDSAEVAEFTEWDCNENGILDSCEIATLPALDLDADGVLDECVPRYKVTDLAEVTGFAYVGVTDISDNGLVLFLGGSNSAANRLYVQDSRSGVVHDVGTFPDSETRWQTCVNSGGIVAGAGRDTSTNEVVVWSAHMTDGALTEVARFEHALGTLYSLDVAGLTETNKLLVQGKTSNAFVGGEWAYRIHFVDVLTGDRTTRSWMYTQPNAVFADGRGIFQSGKTTSGASIRVTDDTLQQVDSVNPPSAITDYWSMARSAAATTGLMAIRQQATSSPNYQPVVVLPPQAAGSRFIDLIVPPGGPQPWNEAWITRAGLTLSYAGGASFRIWPTPAHPDASYDILALLDEVPTNPPDASNTTAIMEWAGMNDDGVFSVRGASWAAWLFEPRQIDPAGLDVSGDTAVDEDDLLALTQLIDAGGGAKSTFDPDLNRDGTLDEQDALDLAWWLIHARSDVLPDCNANGTPDIAELERFGGSLIDADADLIPDGCPPPPICAADLDGDNDTDVLDFALFVAAFGSDGHEPFTGGDLDGDGDVDVLDFGAFLIDFGCEAP